MVNKQKSFLYFSYNTKVNAKLEVVQEVGGVVCGNNDMYLELPTLVGRSKYKTFS